MTDPDISPSEDNDREQGPEGGPPDSNPSSPAPDLRASAPPSAFTEALTPSSDPDGIAPGEFAFPESLQDQSTPTAEPEAVPTHGTAVTALLVAFFVLMLGMLAGGGLAYKFWADRSAAQEALTAAVGAMSATAPAASSSLIGSRLERIQEAIDQGRFVEVASRFQQLSKGAGAGGTSSEWESPLAAIPGHDGSGTSQPGQGLLGAPSAQPGGPGQPDSPATPPSSGLPPGVMEFFERNPKLGKAFGRANLAGRELRDSGGDVTRLREIRSLIIEAARLNDRERVVELLQEFKKEFELQARKLEKKRAREAGAARPRRSRPAAPRRQMGEMASRVNRALQRARLEGRDLREAFPLLRQADRAAAAGEFHRALELSRAALAAIGRAPLLPQTPVWFKNPLVDMFLTLIRREDEQLSSIYRSLEQAGREAPHSSLESLSAAIQNAVEGLMEVGARRRAFGRRLQEIRFGRARPLSPEENEARLNEQAQRARNQVAAILAKAREMTPEEFAAKRSGLVEEILAAVFARRPSERPGAGAQRPVPQDRRVGEQNRSSPPTENTEQRVREKLLSAAGPFLQIKADPTQAELATRLQALFEQARTLLAAGDAASAEKLVDEGLELLGLGAVPTEAPEAEDIDSGVGTPD